MDIPRVVSAAEWVASRRDLLASEKDATRAKDAVDAARRELPVTEVTKDYTFTGPGGEVSLAGLFEGRRQVITYHFMWRARDQSAQSWEPSDGPASEVMSATADHAAHAAQQRKNQADN